MADVSVLWVPYAAPFVQYLMDYHRSHTNAFRLACIVAPPTSYHGGETSFAIPLAAYFSHVHLHVISEHMAETVRKSLSDHYRDHWQQGRFTISSGDPTDVQYIFASRSVDLVIFDDCAFVTNPDDLTNCAKEMLIPNGGLIFTRYNFQASPALLLGGRELPEEMTKLYYHLVWQGQENAAKGTWPAGMKPRFNSGLDYINLDPDAFYEDVTKRVGVNTTPIQSCAFSFHREPNESVRKTDSLHRAKERLVQLKDDPKYGGLERLFVHLIDSNWLAGHYGGSAPEVLQALLAGIEGQGLLQAIWSANLVFATRNMNDTTNK